MDGGCCLIGTELTLGMINKFWRWIVAVVAQHCECTYATEVYTLKMVNVLILIFIYFTTIKI